MLGVGMAVAQGGYQRALSLQPRRGCERRFRAESVRLGIRSPPASLHRSMCRFVAGIGRHRWALALRGDPLPNKARARFTRPPP